MALKYSSFLSNDKQQYCSIVKDKGKMSIVSFGNPLESIPKRG